MQNLELKAYRTSESGSEFLSKHYRETLYQTDTYFKTNNGCRLKLREEQKRAYVIRYDREDKNVERISEYDFYPIDDTNLFKKVFGCAFNVEVVVKKERKLYLYKNARIHLDTVENLPLSFVEIEVVIRSDEDAKNAQMLMQELIDILNIKSDDKISVGYRELLISHLISIGHRELLCE